MHLETVRAARRLIGRRDVVFLELQIIVDVVQAAVLDQQRPAAELAAAAHKHALRPGLRDRRIGRDRVVAPEQLRSGERMHDRGAGIRRCQTNFSGHLWLW